MDSWCKPVDARGQIIVNRANHWHVVANFLTLFPFVVHTCQYTVTDFFAEDKASCIEFCRATHQHPPEA